MMEFGTNWDDYTKSVIDTEAVAFASNDYSLSFGIGGSALAPTAALWALSSPWDPSASLSLDPAMLSPPFSLAQPSPYPTTYAPPPLSPGLTSTLSTLSPTDLIGSSPEGSASGWGSSKASLSGSVGSVGEESTSDYHSGSPHHTSGSEETCHEEERVKPKRRRKMTDKRREQNRLAQRNLRARRQALQSEHLGRVEELEQQNGELREALSRLREENIRLRKLQKKE